MFPYQIQQVPSKVLIDTLGLNAVLPPVPEETNPMTKRDSRNAFLLVHQDVLMDSTTMTNTTHDYSAQQRLLGDLPDICDTVKVWLLDSSYVDTNRVLDTQPQRDHGVAVAKVRPSLMHRSTMMNGGHCVALVAKPTPDTNQVFHWNRRRYDSISRIGTPPSLHVASPPAMSSLFLGDHKIRTELHHYLSQFPLVLKQLQSVLQQQLGTASANTSNRPKHKSNTQTNLVVMTTIAKGVPAQTLWQNFECAARRFGIDFANWLVVCTDEPCASIAEREETKGKNRSDGPAFYYNANLVSTAIQKPEERRILTQVYVTQMVLHLGYNLVVLDTTTQMIVPESDHEMEPFNITRDAKNGNSPKAKEDEDDWDDLSFRPLLPRTVSASPSDKNQTTPSTVWTSRRQQVHAPWTIDTGIFFVKSNVRTKYLWTRMVVSMDQYLDGAKNNASGGSHDKKDGGGDEDGTADTHFATRHAVALALSQLVWELTSTFGLRPRVLPLKTRPGGSYSNLLFVVARTTFAVEDGEKWDPSRILESLKASGHWFLSDDRGCRRF